MVGTAAAAVPHRRDPPERMGCGEDDLVVLLGHDDGLPAVGREVQVVRAGHRDPSLDPGRPRVDGHQLVGSARLHVERAEVPRRRHMLRQRSGVQNAYDPVGALTDHRRDRRAVRVRNVQVRRVVRDPRRDPPRGRCCIDVVPDDGGHPRQWVAELRGGPRMLVPRRLTRLRRCGWPARAGMPVVHRSRRGTGGAAGRDQSQRGGRSDRQAPYVRRTSHHPPVGSDQSDQRGQRQAGWPRSADWQT